jgi:hypothetical protein
MGLNCSTHTHTHTQCLLRRGWPRSTYCASYKHNTLSLPVLLTYLCSTVLIKWSSNALIATMPTHRLTAEKQTGHLCFWLDGCKMTLQPWNRQCRCVICLRHIFFRCESRPRNVLNSNWCILSINVFNSSTVSRKRRKPWWIDLFAVKSNPVPHVERVSSCHRAKNDPLHNGNATLDCNTSRILEHRRLT